MAVWYVPCVYVVAWIILHKCPYPQIWHGRTIVYDPSRLSLEHDVYPHHVSPNDIVFETQPRVFFRQAEHAFIKPGVEHNFTLLQPYPLAADTLQKEGQPWVLHM